VGTSCISVHRRRIGSLDRKTASLLGRKKRKFKTETPPVLNRSMRMKGRKFGAKNNEEVRKRDR